MRGARRAQRRSTAVVWSWVKRVALLLSAGALLVTAASFAVRESSDPRFALESIAVTGNAHAGSSEIVTAAALPRGENVWLMDVRGALARVEALPWVRSAAIHRSWPNRVRISVVERVPVARIRLPSSPEDPAAGGQYALIDADANVLDVGATVLERHLPVFGLNPLPAGATEPGASLAQTDAAVALDAARRLNGLGVRYAEIDIDPATGFSAVLLNGLRVAFGNADRLRQKIALLAAIVPRIHDTAAVRYLDLRSTNAPTVLYK